MSNGVISGTPGVGTGGVYNITVDASNAGGTIYTNYALTVDESPTITSANSTTFDVGDAGTYLVTSSGSSYPTPAVSETGALPSGVTFVDNGNGSATLSGTPAPNSGGAYDLTITSSNTTGTTTQSFVLYVDQAPAITSANTATFTYNESGSFDVTTTGYPNVSCLKTGALPNGVTFAPSGALAGTPSQFGTFNFNIDCTNGYGTDATQSFSLVVDAPPAFSTGSSATFTASSSGSFTVSAVGYPSPSFSESGALPSGVTFVDNGNGSATLSGTPGASSGGSYTFNIIASNTVANTTQSFTLTVDAAPVFTSPNTMSVNAGAAFSETVTTADGYPVPTMATTTTLPSGVTLRR